MECRVTKITKGRAARSLTGNILTLRKEIGDMTTGNTRDGQVEKRNHDPVGSGMAPGGQAGESSVVRLKLSEDQQDHKQK